LFGLNKSSKSKDGYHPECKKCVKERKAIYYIKNKINISKLDGQRKKLRRQTNLQCKLQNSMRSRLYQALKNKQKSGSAIKDLGCSIRELIIHLQNKFQKGMTWNNYGNKKNHWNIDHILSLSKFDLSNRKELLIACNFSNLQPLWTTDNIKKSNN
jgi:hypothetical protein